jgi:hypothetical protein
MRDHVREALAGGRMVACIELLVAAALVYSANVLKVVPVSETPWLVAIGWASLRMRGLAWRSVGFAPPQNWGKTAGLALAAGVFLQVASEYLIEPLAQWATGQKPDLSSFQSLAGNPVESLVMLIAVWTLAAFGEEMGYRGYVLERAAALGGHTQAAYGAAVAGVALLFGLGHYYQGLAGIVGSTFSGLLFGGLYLASGKNLWMPILAHGFSDTIGLAMIYLGYLPK